MEYTLLTILFTSIAIWGGRRGATLKSFGPHVRALLWAQIYLRPPLLNPKKRILRRAKTLMDNPEYLTVYGGMLSSFIFIFCVLLVFNTSYFVPIIAFILTFIIVWLVNYRIPTPGSQSYQATMLEAVAKKYQRYASAEESAVFLKEMMSYRTPEAMHAACKGFKLLPEAFYHPSCPEKNPRKPQQLFSDELIQEAEDWNDFEFEEKKLAEKETEPPEAAESIEIPMPPLPSNMAMLPKEVERYQKLQKQRYNPFLQRPDSTLAMAAKGDLIDQLLIGNHQFKAGFDDLYCRKCNAFAEHIFRAEWNWVWCRQCQDVDGFAFEVKKVVGRIGPFQEELLSAGTLELSLWNAETNIAIAADIDRLEIMGGADFDYDWAINAVIEKITNRGAQHRKMDLVMTNSPQLHINTQRILDKFEAEHKR